MYFPRVCNLFYRNHYISFGFSIKSKEVIVFPQDFQSKLQKSIYFLWIFNDNRRTHYIPFGCSVKVIETIVFPQDVQSKFQKSLYCFADFDKKRRHHCTSLGCSITKCRKHRISQKLRRGWPSPPALQTDKKNGCGHLHIP